MTEPVLSEQHEQGVLHLELNRPAKRNALSAELRGRLVDSLDRAAGDDRVGAVLLSGAGSHFCAGFDLAEIAEADDPAAVFADSVEYHRRVHGFPKPIIAAVAGAAVAGGFDLALMCDVRVAAADATFGQTQVRHGIPASYELLAAVVGDSTARELCLTGRLIDAEEARRLGVVHRIERPAELTEKARALASDIASRPASSVMKQQFVDNQRSPFG